MSTCRRRSTCRRSSRGELAVTADGYGVRFLKLAPLIKPWVRFPVLERTPVGRYVGQVANALAMLAPLRAALDEDHIDVVCLQEYWTARFDMLARALDRPVVAVDQGLPDRREIKWLKRGAFRASAGAIVQTEGEAAKVGRYGADARRIPNAVDVEFFNPDPARAPTGGEPEVLFVGRLHDAQKRVSDVLKALWLLPDAWRLTIVGGGPDEAALRAAGGRARRSANACRSRGSSVTRDACATSTDARTSSRCRRLTRGCRWCCWRR